MVFAVSADNRVKLKESNKKDKYLDFARELIKLEHESDVYTNYNWCSYGGARGVIVIVVGNEHGDTSSNPGRDWLHFT